MKKVLYILILVLIGSTLFAQNEAPKPSIQVAGFIDNGKVLLRWAPENHVSWQRANKAGYTIYRKTVIRNGKVIDKPDSTLIGMFQPVPLNGWKKYVDSSTFAIAAEAIYGSGMEMTVTSQNSFFEQVNIARDQQSRFSIGLLCADQSFTVAQMMGLGAIDSTVKTNEAYLYIVRSNYTDSIEVNQVGYVLVDFSFGNLLPRPFGITHQLNGCAVTFSMPYEPFRGIYTNFELERSTDGNNFFTVVGKNYYSMSTTDDDAQSYIVSDSVKLEASTYYYRIRGRTPFDTFGPYSDIIEVNVMPSIDVTPWITDIKEVDDKIAITWAMDSVDNQYLKGFMVYQSANHDGPFEPVFKDLVDKSVNLSYTQKPSDYSYYRIAAIDQFDRPYFSSSRLFQAKDSIPPLPPTGLKGEFDSTGVVKFTWKYGNEPDLLGYQLLYSATDSDEHTLLSHRIIYDSTYTANFPLSLLSCKLYFKLVALDTRYNTSRPSEPIVLVKPDTIPPSAPVLTLESDSIGNTRVSIAPSKSSDVVRHTLYFEGEGNTPREIFSGTILADTSFIINSNLGKGIVYCTAVDITGRKGISSRIPINSAKTSELESFKVNYKVNIDEGRIELYWDAKSTDGIVMIYRKTKNEKFKLIGTVNINNYKFNDLSILLGNIYNYKTIFIAKDKSYQFYLDVFYK
ncbi:MAG: hypothetical protein WBJ36_09505 [Tenuifilum sp.]|uniref:fibronectin type III domain-containing protein n=1 Tax=Tenuifilum sp. TaxID=2760880 RepID=UPI001B42F319|nr:hypothetical protein [Bacteroidales bacterium]MBP9029216.1 hypothetical protein [Bacteroidales bacterium]